jgi:hypothetical protein
VAFAGAAEPAFGPERDPDAEPLRREPALVRAGCLRRADGVGVGDGLPREAVVMPRAPRGRGVVDSAAEASAGAGVARLSLRRCGRRRGSAPRTSDGRSLLKGYIMAHRRDRRRTGRMIMSSRCGS